MNPNSHQPKNLLPDVHSQLAREGADYDYVLWQKFVDGSESAFIEIYRKNFDGLFIYGCRFSNCEQLVEDTIQDLFIDLRKKRESLGSTHNIRFYLMVALRRRLLREMSRRHNRMECFSGEMFFLSADSHEEVLIREQIAAENILKLNAALDRISAKKREVLYYVYFEGLCYEQIREIMGFKHVRSVRNLLYETVSILRSYMDKP